MPQFQGSLGPIEDFGNERRPGPPRPSKKRAAEPVLGASNVALPVRKSKRYASPERLIDLAILFVVGLVLLGALR